ncbi:LacI family DNA-binding transcriptional regulator [Gracilibacillus marinus]|jgi:LacI family transcriptional regulator, sucrose operon repressor|uniref:LacI family DNA-binding transcriptional regulator n=1 Tax=Gracilibacillus marinus TaxID=630535 RepID=A0ABV8VW14_9BACI
MTTINDIAKLAGVSRSTVSRFLNKSGYVSEEAKENIKAVIEETGYMPSQSAKSLRTNKTSVIGVILPKISTETASRVMSGINRELGKYDYQPLLADTGLDKEKELRYLALLQSRNVDGIIVLGTNTDDKMAEAIKRLRIPVIVVGQEFDEIPCIVYPDYEATCEAIEYMIKKGRRKIGFIGVPESDPAVGIVRKKAYVDTLMKHQLMLDKKHVQIGDFSIQSGYNAMQRIWKDSEEIDSVFVVTDRMAVGAVKFLKEKNIVIPEQFAIATTGASSLAEYIDPSLTTVDFLNEQAGEKAATLIMQLISGEKVNEKLVHTYRLLKRNSV